MEVVLAFANRLMTKNGVNGRLVSPDAVIAGGQATHAAPSFPLTRLRGNP